MKTLFTSKPPVKRTAARQFQSGPVQRHRRPFEATRLVRLSLLMLSGCSLLLLVHTILATILPPTPQAITCSALMRAADYSQAVGLQPQQQSMAAVQVVDGLVGDAPAALVQVTNKNAQATLDVYVFGCVLDQQKPQLTQVFAQRDLIHGAVTLTPQHTLLLESQDTRVSRGMLPLLQPLQQNVYREYTWQQHGFVQLLFPGFYPVTSRAEADTLQQSANAKQKLPWNDPVSTALQMSKDLLHWSPASQAQLLTHTAESAVVALTRQNPHVVLMVTLKQLIQPGSGGMWFVTDARTKGMLLTQPGALDQLLAVSQSSPISFGGANVLIDGETTATLFDHTLTSVSGATNLPLKVRKDSTYRGTLIYTNLAPGQQGVLLIQSLPRSQNRARESGQLLLTGVILN